MRNLEANLQYRLLSTRFTTRFLRIHLLPDFLQKQTWFIRGIPKKKFIIMVLGGPNNYRGRDMKKAHVKTRAEGAGNAEFDKICSLLVKTLEEFKICQADIDGVVAVLETTRKDIVEG
eukprot:Platyproteum_vivax@DN2695_c0_g1_i1.p1